jgi:hypothetical protein
VADTPPDTDDDGQGGMGAGGTGGVGGEGGEGGAPVAPPLRNPVDLPNDELAYQALILMGVQELGATTQRCSECHSMNAGLMGMWMEQTDAAVASCFADTTVPTVEAAEEVLSCLRMTSSATSPFSTPKLGIYSAAAHLDWFNFVFERVYGADAAAERDDFLTEVGMPKIEADGMTQAEFDIVAEWFARGLPFLNELLPEDPPPGGCDGSISPEVPAYIEQMKLEGWRAVNAENNILMFGCAGATTPLDCLSTYPQASTTAYGDVWEHLDGAKIRVLRENHYSSSYWTRSSADGRFVAHGGASGGGSTIVDLEEDREIPTNAAYDPGFFPDNSGFVFQGTPSGSDFCRQSLLTGSPVSVNFNEPECVGSTSVGLYQHVGAALGGGDYWVVDGEFVSDNGGHSATTENPAAYFGGDSAIDLTPMFYTGSAYAEKNTIVKSTPSEGDTVISPSSGFLLSRVTGPSWEQNGFTMRKLNATPSGMTYSVEVPQVARYCINGGKPGISFDERYAVLHSYVTAADAVELGFTGPGDPGFAAYASQGAANLYLIDLKTSIIRRITHMKPGQYAFSPHFRSDGWIYFMVRIAGSSTEYIAASDAALVVETP